MWGFYGYPIAEYGTEYAFRTLIAPDGLGANPVSVTLYPKAGMDEDGLGLTGGQSYRIHFDEGNLPPVGE